MRSFLLGVLAAGIVLGALIRPAPCGQSPFQVVSDPAPLTLAPGHTFERTVTIRVPDEHYLYASETNVEFSSLEGILITDIRYPRASRFADPYLGKEVDIFRGDTPIVISGRVPEGAKGGLRELSALVHLRGCSPTICYRAEETRVLFRIDVLVESGAALRAPPTVESVSALPRTPDAQPLQRGGVRRLLDVQDFGLVLEQGFLWTLLVVFIAGLLTSLTPCIWPILPAVLLFIGVHPHKRLRENVALAASLVAGLVLVYALLGIAAVVFGKNLGFLYQQRWFLALVVLFFLAMSLSMFGVFDIRMPRRLHHRLHQMGGKGYRGAFLAGMGMGLVASPCAGPILAALLGHVALQRDFVAGFLLLVVYGTGMGSLIVLVGAGYGALAGRLRGGPWMVWIRRSLGLLLLFPAAFYMGSLFRWSPGAIIGGGGSSRIPWVGEESEVLRLAAETGKPVIVEFSAEWCPPCRALDEGFFGRQAIADLAAGFVPLRVDATVETPRVRALIDKHRVIGWPTVVFLNSQGQPYEDLRINDFNPGAIERSMHEALRRAGKEGP